MNIRACVVVALFAAWIPTGCFQSGSERPMDASWNDAGDSSVTADAGSDADVPASLLASVVLTPAEADSSTLLRCVPTARVDPNDTGTIQYVFSWTVDDIGVPEAGDTLTTVFPYKGARVRCAVTATDGIHPEARLLSNIVTIGNQLPTLAGVSLTPGVAFETTTLACTPGAASDGDGDTIEFAFTWRVNGAVIAPVTPTLDGAYFNKNDVVGCEATPSDGSSAGSAVASSTVTISDSLPVVTHVDVGPNPITHINDWNCNETASDADGDYFWVEYDWFTAARSISSGSYPHLNGIFFVHGDSVRCRATPWQRQRVGAKPFSGVADTSDAHVVANTPPGFGYTGNLVGRMSPEDVDSGRQPLTCEVAMQATDPDHDVVTYSFEWTKNSLPYTGATNTPLSSTVPASDIAVGDHFECKLIASDGWGGENWWTGWAYGAIPSYTLGYSEPFANPTVGNVSGLVARATPIVVTSQVSLLRLGVVMQSAGTYSVGIALHEDDNGHPGTSITGVQTATFTGDRIEVPSGSVGRRPTLAPGTYWVVVAFSGDAPQGHASTGLATDVVYSYPVSYYFQFPYNFSGLTPTTGLALDQYAVVREQ